MKRFIWTILVAASVAVSGVSYVGLCYQNWSRRVAIYEYRMEQYKNQRLDGHIFPYPDNLPGHAHDWESVEAAWQPPITNTPAFATAGIASDVYAPPRTGALSNNPPGGDSSKPVWLEEQ